VALAQHRFADTRAAAEKLRDAQPGKSLPYQLLGDAQIELGDLDAAAGAYGELERLDGSTVGTEFRMARVGDDARRTGRRTRTPRDNPQIGRRGRAAAVDLTSWACVQLGEFMFKRGDFDAADVQYQAALRLAPQQWSVLEHLAELEAARGHDTKALELYQRALHAAPRPELWQMVGDYHLFMKRPAEAANATSARSLAIARRSTTAKCFITIISLASTRIH
jgi:tetratricopeptide (TPR) repeat protein